MEKNYDPNLIEPSWYKIWEENNFFAPRGKGKPFSIVIPPPNVTGTLHMGHGFQLSLMDALIRYHRMLGFNTLWQVGTDHAGIATQMVVEQQLIKAGKTRFDLGREEFVKKIWAWKEISEKTITGQQKRLGISCDWSRKKFTLDPELVEIVTNVFIKLYQEGLIYRGKRLVNWDPVLKTAISDLEVENQEKDGFLWHISYPLVGEKAALVIATTRPETLLGDVAVAVNPKDTRYQKLVGKKVLLPLAKREIPIIADNFVDQEFATGCVKITPAHDFNDYAVGLRHNLPLLNIFTPAAHLNENTPKEYQGLDRFVARKKIIADLEQQGLLVKVEPYRNKIPIGDRSNSVIEPYLTDQWFVKTKELADPAISALKNGEFKFVPENWDKTYFQWLETIEDWCISRQLWWGHRIPAWYDEKNNVYVGRTLEEVQKKYNLSSSIKLTQDPDVLDTWFSSALWPFSTLDWTKNNDVFKNFYPTSVLVTGFDIIFFWVARMVMMGLKFTEKVPFHKVYITGLIRDSFGQKMSKSKGNILDPMDLINGISLEDLVAKRTANLMQPQLAPKIEKATRKEFPQGIPAFGADALRFTLCALASTSRDINFDLARLEGYRNFCNKLWNAARYVLNTPALLPELVEGSRSGFINSWIESELQKTILSVKENFDQYRFDLVAQKIYDFVWHEYCDWYLELTKPILQNPENSPEKENTIFTLFSVLEKILRLIHPLMPFLSEEIWQLVAKHLNLSGKTIMLEAYPLFDANKVDQKATEEVVWLKKNILAIRNIRGEMNISPQKTLFLILNQGTKSDREKVARNEIYFRSLARIEKIAWLEDTDKKGKKFLKATALLDGLELQIPLEGIIDKKVELARIEKEIIKTITEITRLEEKMSNPNFITHAPEELLVTEKARLKELKIKTEKLNVHRTEIEEI
jgi:valyl-tRNA synthetase